jgi:hypothetical protein
MKSRIKKPTVEEGSKYLAACRGEWCYLRVVRGEASPETATRRETARA